MLKVGLLAGLVMAFVFLAGAPASAHAQLLSTEPTNGATLSASPNQVVLHFGENVEVPLGSVRVYNSADQSVEKGIAAHLNGDQHSVAVKVPHLPAGGYVATWRVISADSHPVHGAFTFQVGNLNTNTSSLAQKLVSEGQGNTLVGVIYGFFRALLIGATTILIGSLTFIYLIAPPGWGRVAVRRPYLAALLTLLIATGAVFALQGVYVAGFPISRIFNAHLLGAVVHTRLGTASLSRLVLLLAFAAATPLLIKRRALGMALFAILSAGLILTLTLSGHAVTGRWIPLAIAADVIHVASACAWAGGLVVFALVWPREPDESLSQLIARFSALALVCVALLTITGVFQGYRQLGTLNSLFGTAYGVILIVKVLLVALMVALGKLARQKLHESDHVRRSVRIETMLTVAVFLVTSLLMNAAPSAAATGKPFSGGLTAGNLIVDAIVTPDRTGSNSIHLYVLSNVGVETDPPELSASLTLKAHDLGPIPIPLMRLAPGHWAGYSFIIPISGKWTMDVTIRTSQFDEVTGSLTLPVN